MNFKRIIKRKILGYKADSDSYIEYLKNLGVKIGKGVEIYRPFNTTIDIQNPHMLRIGNNVQMTGPVTILTHDYSWSIIKSVYGEILGNQQETVIGDNVFIGWGATILGGILLGCSRTVAAEFSFFLAIPAMVAASAKDLLEFDLSSMNATLWIALILGFIVAFIVSVVVMEKFVSYLKKRPMRVFAVYRIGAGIIFAILMSFGVLKI